MPVTQSERSYAAEAGCSIFQLEVSVQETLRLIKSAYELLGTPRPSIEVHPAIRQCAEHGFVGEYQGSRKGPSTLHIYQRGLNVGTIAHEIAHSLAPDWDTHGPDWRGQFVRVVRLLWPWTAWGDELEAAFKGA